jgi:hypothetical protein
VKNIVRYSVSVAVGVADLKHGGLAHAFSQILEAGRLVKVELMGNPEVLEALGSGFFGSVCDNRLGHLSF